MQFPSVIILVASALISVNAAPTPQLTPGPIAFNAQQRVSIAAANAANGINRGIAGASIAALAGVLAANGAIQATGGAVIGSVAGAAAGAHAGWCAGTGGIGIYVPCNPANPPTTPPPSSP